MNLGHNASHEAEDGDKFGHAEDSQGKRAASFVYKSSEYGSEACDARGECRRCHARRRSAVMDADEEHQYERNDPHRESCERHGHDDARNVPSGQESPISRFLHCVPFGVLAGAVSRAFPWRNAL